MSEITKRKSFKNRDAWRAWLEKSHAREKMCGVRIACEALLYRHFTAKFETM
jgi:hypothetical protein